MLNRNHLGCNLVLRQMTAAILVLFVPIALAQSTGVGVVYGVGSVYLNGSQLSNSNAVTAGDVIQTKENGTVTITSQESSIVLEPNSTLRFQGGSVALDRGAVSVATSKGLSVNARDFKITPTSTNWTQFYVTRANGVIDIIARKNDVRIDCASNTTTIKEGHQISRADAENCGLFAKKGGAPPAASAPIISAKTAEWAAIAAGGGLAAWALLYEDEPVSPDKP